MAEGTADEPIIFTAELDDGSLIPADHSQWGGLIVLGYAPVYKKGSTVLNVEGIPSSETRGSYGGNNPEDNSGIIKYVSIRYTGIGLAPGDEIQGLNLLKQGDESREFAIAEYAALGWVLDELTKRNNQFDTSVFAQRLKTVRNEEFKYIWASNGNHELYNIRNDPKELDNIIENNPAKAEELKGLLKDWLDSFEPAQPEIAQQVQ